jgi:aminoglycoside phosphotransferase family enzyme/predicted kinase
MIVEDQCEVIEFLSAPSTHGGATVDRIDTHTAVVFLAGRRAYKMKRAVRFDYVDFSTLDRRHRFCEAELRLNRRTAPGLYRSVLPVARGHSGLVLGGEGRVVEWLVEMERFDQARLLDRIATAGGLELDLMLALASAVAVFHVAASRRHDHGGKKGMAWVVEGNAAGFSEFAGAGLDPALSDRVVGATRQELEQQGACLDERRRTGFVRECHGDLHLRNIVLLDGRPTLFDGVEFNDEISCIDVMYDLAFLLMDLGHRRLPRHANVVLNRYLSETDDVEALRLLPLFLSCRAAVRAKTSATAANLQEDGNRRRELQEAAGEYLAMAERLLHSTPPSLVAIGGFSGSGKSTAAMAVAPDVGRVPGAVVVRSDEIRKHMLGRPSLDRLGPEGYAPEVSARVYESLVDRARMVIRQGHSAIVDAVFARPAEREAIERVAREQSVPFVGCWLTAPESVLLDRARQRRGDASDADASVIRQQLARDVGPLRWHRCDASGRREAVAGAVLDLVHGAAARP